MKIIKLELTEQEAGLLRGAIDFVIKAGGINAARQLLFLDDKIIAADKLAVEEAGKEEVK
ncbi:MAG TPA: hypothetical protein VLG09_04260 [Candidatus Saccharimonadales bacterium]|nr:hypothetical protein [Candidatus Saccharimonadales bacterium]